MTNNDWVQHGNTPQRTNYTPEQTNGPYKVIWRWYGVPFSSRAQPIVSGTRLFMGSTDGNMYCRNADTGAAVWQYATGGAIRHTAATDGTRVYFHSYDGYVYCLSNASGAFMWRTQVGAGLTAPLIYGANLVVGTNEGNLVKLNSLSGAVSWTLNTKYPIRCSPSLSEDESLILYGDEAMYARAAVEANGKKKWHTKLDGQSMMNGLPVVIGNTVTFRTMPILNFNQMLLDGDIVMNSAGALQPTITTDWPGVRTAIINDLTANPVKKTFHALNVANGTPKGIAPVLYTNGCNLTPSSPAYNGATAYTIYRARRGIQTDTPTPHVSSQYDAELGVFNPTTLDITGLPITPHSTANWRMTSDEPACLTIGGNLLWIDNQERLGNINPSTGAENYAGHLATCVGFDYCGNGVNGFFPIPGFPTPVIPYALKTEGRTHAGVVLANNAAYWRIDLGGLMGLANFSDARTLNTHYIPAPAPATLEPLTNGPRPISNYVTQDMNLVPVSPNPALVAKLQAHVMDFVRHKDHPLPLYQQRGYATRAVWPIGSIGTSGTPPEMSYASKGNVLMFDPAELLYSVALAYPFMTAIQKPFVKAWMDAEIARWSPLVALPYTGSNNNWIDVGTPREWGDFPFRSGLNGFPAPSFSLFAFYALWIWGRNTGDNSFAIANQTLARNQYNVYLSGVRYYNDIAGLIGYYRIANFLGWVDAATAQSNAITALNTVGFSAMNSQAKADFKNEDAVFKTANGFQLPSMFGLVPEMGAFLGEKTFGAAKNEIITVQDFPGERFWMWTRSENSLPFSEYSTTSTLTHWSHFLARAYVMLDTQAQLIDKIDYPLCDCDIYWIQRIVAAIVAP